VILIDVKNYLSQKQTATLQELSLHFQRDPDFIRQLLSHWIKKGIISPAEKPIGCGTRCTQCRPEIAQVYRFI